MIPKPTTVLRTAALLTSVLVMAPAARAALLTFDDLGTPPPVDSATGLQYANNNSLSYGGVVWDGGIVVVGKDYRVDSATPGPLFGVPHSGNYYIRNEGPAGANDGMLLTTPLVLTGAWFARNTYYGYDDGGADQITIVALGGLAELASVVFDLPQGAIDPDPVPGSGDRLPGIPAFVDTSSFLALSGITGYRIDRRSLGATEGHWVADDFTFVGATVQDVPEPASAVLLLTALGLMATCGRRRAGAAPAAAWQWPCRR